MRIYKYMQREFVDTFLDRGRILFRPSSYFRDYEETQIRGDTSRWAFRRNTDRRQIGDGNLSWLPRQRKHAQ